MERMMRVRKHRGGSSKSSQPHPWDVGAVTPTRNCSGIPNPAVPCSWAGSRPAAPTDPALCHPLAPSQGDFPPWKCPCCSTHPARINKSLCSTHLRAQTLGYSKLNTQKKSLLCLLPSLEFFHSQDDVQFVSLPCPHPGGHHEGNECSQFV